MREGKFELLENMLSLATRIPKKDDVSKLVSDFYFNLAGSIHPGNTAIVFLNDLEELREKFKEKELPQTQEEFESRASLFQLMNELEDYLRLKNRFKKIDLKKIKQKQEKYESQKSILKIIKKLEDYKKIKNRYKKTDLKKMNKNKKIKTDII